ncbi:fumarylacetoacetate (FAA) hydrolase [Oscillochloris trichoides DG-6]|uniref:Fumarylacetoacetate (FAA) hydrolase n=1 Tax=Oscillochloris trichoides DG-6 TaxID=765420 RepID=E1IH38_9CHLR|nr:fumarylacetoacetate hydrolase family protein [Oscillochloris trichoides]EFO79513.1 fumarylacetoacetate (FAA) hydrolase [Oscillochloris trichoides DG-6]
MRLVTFSPPAGPPRAGVLLGAAVVDLAAAAPLVLEAAEEQRWDLLSLLQADQDDVNLETAADIVAAVVQLSGGAEIGSSEFQIGGAAMLLPLTQVRLLAPLPRPASVRDFFAFEQHVAAAAALRGLSVPSEWYRIPTFYFSNHAAIYGPDASIPMPQTEALDYELELACVIGRTGRNIHPAEAHEYIAGYTIMNDWSARDLQLQEMAIGLGPAKGKDFATSLGPYLVTPDELELYTDDDGGLSLTMHARVNGEERSVGNAASMYYRFADLIAHASRDVTLYPGDVLGSGTVGGGCLLELTQGYGPWLARGDVVELEITGLGVLRNTIE